MSFLRIVLAFVAAVAITVLLAAIIQTQFNLAELQALGIEIPLDLRLDTTEKDLTGFTPGFGTLVAVGFLVGFIVAALIARKLQSHQRLLYTVAGATAVTAILLIMDLAFGITVVAAARSVGGIAALVAAGAIGGLAFDMLRPGKPAG